jgi:hypothetical protein
MITMLGSPRLCCDGVTRRETLKAGALSLLGGFFNLPSLLALEQAGQVRPGKAKSVMLIYLQGGPATQDMFDLKPNAPSGIRSEFKPIATNVPGISVCEHLPKLAQWMHKTVVVRSAYHKGICHSNLPMYTGWDPSERDQSPLGSDPPSMGSVCAYAEEQGILKKRQSVLPPYVYLPCPLGWGEVVVKAGPGGGFLGPRYDPLCTECTAHVDRPYKGGRSDDLQPVRGEILFKGTELPENITIDRLVGRRSLLEQLDERMRHLEAEPAPQGFAKKQQLAYDLMTSARVREAFDLKREPERLQERYGRTLFGSAMLLGRRLIERGARFVNVSWDNMRERFSPPASYYCWDTHERNFPILRNHLPHLDQTYSALMEDLEQRGLLDETLVVMMGEMGRTPELNKDGGRDHWISCYSVVLAGAGVRGGMAYGASDSHARFVKDKPVRIRDICATIYACLGLDPDMPVHERGGRPISIAQGGQPVHDILA